MQRISSKDNSLIKHIKKLKEKKYRQQYGEYVVDVQSNAYKHLPANTVFEGISLPVNDVNGNPVDYTKETNSGATQKDSDATSKIAELHGDDDIQDGMEVYSLGGMRLYNTGDASGLFKKAMVKNGKTIFIKVQ